MKTRGFTLIEMLVAVMILTLSVTALLSVSAGTANSVRYSKNKIIATWLAQQALDTVRNSRDTAMIQNPDPTTSDWWSTWVSTNLGIPGGTKLVNGHRVSTSGTICYSPYGCFVPVPSIMNSGDYPGETAPPQLASPCSGPGACPVLVYNQNDTQYEYPMGKYGPVATNGGFTIQMQVSNGADADVITVTVNVSWLDGTATRNISQSIMLTNWQL
ncbi:MAG: type II secretion system protein [bacterium]